MTIEDIWNKLLTLDLIPIFEVLAMSLVTGLAVAAVFLGGVVWWLHKREQ